MSSLSSDSEFISNSESSEFSGYELEAESQSIEQTLSSSDLSSEDEAYAYGNDPIAVAEWTANYEADSGVARFLALGGRKYPHGLLEGPKARVF